MSGLGGNSPSEDVDKSNNLVGPPGADSTVPGPEGPASTVPGPPGNDGVVASVVGGTNTTVDATDPANPIVNVSVPSSSPTTTKGDIIARGASVDERVAVGTDGQVLTADAASPAGVKYTTPAGGSAGANFFELPADTGYATCGEIAKTASQRTDATISADLVWIDFIYFDGTTSIDQIAVNSATASGGGDLIISLHPILSRLSIGDQSFTGTITVSTSANTKHTQTVSWSPTKGWYALTSWCPVSLANIIMVSASTASGIAGWFPAGAWTKIGETEVERKAHIVRKTNYDTTPDLSGIDFNDLSIYDSANQEELTDVGTMPFVELRYS